MQNEKGDVRTCQASGFGLVGSIVASSYHQSCKEKLQSAGYKEVN